MIPFERTWPYEIMMNDVYVNECPFCGSANVILPLKPADLQTIREGKKKIVVFPCCHQHITVIDADQDYLLASRVLRK